MPRGARHPARAASPGWSATAAPSPRRPLRGRDQGPPRLGRGAPRASGLGAAARRRARAAARDAGRAHRRAQPARPLRARPLGLRASARRDRAVPGPLRRRAAPLPPRRAGGPGALPGRRAAPRIGAGRGGVRAVPPAPLGGAPGPPRRRRGTAVVARPATRLARSGGGPHPAPRSRRQRISAMSVRSRQAWRSASRSSGSDARRSASTRSSASPVQSARLRAPAARRS